MVFIIFFLILFLGIAYLEWLNTKLENDIELLQSDISCEKFKNKWFTFAEREPRKNEYFIIKKRITSEEIESLQITEEGLMYEVFVGYLNDENIFFGGSSEVTFVMKLDELKKQGYFWRYV